MKQSKNNDSISRQNLRLKDSVWQAIDDSCAVRAGAVSRNTWITEAIIEKLANEARKTTGSKRGTNHA